MATLDRATLHNIIESLATERLRFCSEADFQFALGWKIQQEFPHAEIRFECPATLVDKSIKIDIVVNLDGVLFPIELKWKLKSHQAETDNREKMLRDADRLAKVRMEDLKDLHFTGKPETILNRFAIWLTDNDRYWNKEGTNKILDYKGIKISWESYDDEFRFALIDVMM
jgi:hypothetical protein